MLVRVAYLSSKGRKIPLHENLVDFQFFKWEKLSTENQRQGRIQYRIKKNVD
jgi:hypothetical protein